MDADWDEFRERLRLTLRVVLVGSRDEQERIFDEIVALTQETIGADPPRSRS